MNNVIKLVVDNAPSKNIAKSSRTKSKLGVNNDNSLMVQIMILMEKLENNALRLALDDAIEKALIGVYD